VTPVRLTRSRTFRLALIYLCLFSTAVLALVGLVYWYATDSLSRQIDATIDAEIRGLAEQYHQRGTRGLLAAVERRASGAAARRGLYLLVDRDFTPLAGNISRWPDEPPDDEGWVTFRLGFPESEENEEGAEELEGVNFGRARLFDLSGGLHLLVGNDVRERARVQNLVAETLGWGLAVILVLSLAGALLMSRFLLSRIEDINAASREIMGGHLNRRVPVSPRGDEFDEVAGNLNAMLDRIERLLDATKEVSDNIAHDLRSPLARLRSRLELLTLEDPNLEDYREATAETLAEVDQILKTFAALLAIAEAEAGAAQRSFAALELADLVRDVGELYEPLAEARGLTLELSVGGPARLHGDRDVLFQAVSNLLDNAVKYAPEGSAVRLELSTSAGEARVAVADRGAGIPPELRDKVLERFFRAETSRSTAGSGLGLSLVAAAARLHGGRIALEDNDPGLRAVLSLPLRPEPRVSAGAPAPA
jgi:signal transduction histidine kinase